MKSILIVVKEEFLAKGIALALMENFQSIHSTKNPFEALKIASKEKIDLIITELKFKTLDSRTYLDKVIDTAETGSAIIILSDDKITIDYKSKELNLIIYNKPISIKKIKNLIDSLIGKSKINLSGGK